MKVAAISTGVLPAPPKGYGGLEMIVANVAKEAARQGNEVYLITTDESEWIGTQNAVDSDNPDKVIGSLTTIGYGPTEWTWNSERNMFIRYHEWLEKEFGDGQGIVWDSSWFAYPYLSLKAKPNMKIIHSHHGMSSWVGKDGRPSTPEGIVHPRLLGVSSQHAQYLSDFFHIPVRFVHNGIDIPPQPDPFPCPSGDYLLSLNRISREKGIHNCIDIAVETGNKLILVGDDQTVLVDQAHQQYVYDIQQRAEKSGGLVEYRGLVDSNTKWDLIKNCKALIACPELGYVEAFYIAAVEGNAMGKPLIGLGNGGMRDIIKNDTNGFLAGTNEQVKEILRKGILDPGHFDPKTIREMSLHFSTENVTKTYLSIFERVLADDERYRW